jgi:hypothetical protein
MSRDVAKEARQLYMSLLAILATPPEVIERLREDIIKRVNELGEVNSSDLSLKSQMERGPQDD